MLAVLQQRGQFGRPALAIWKSPITPTRPAPNTGSVWPNPDRSVWATLDRQAESAESRYSKVLDVLAQFLYPTTEEEERRAERAPEPPTTPDRL